MGTGRKKIEAFIQKRYPEFADDILLADGFDECLLGFVTNQQGNPVAVYDKTKMLQTLAKSLGGDEEGALEYFEANLAPVDVGEFTPKYLEPYK